MYTPIMWANPNELKHIQEKRKVEYLEETQEKKAFDKRPKLKERVIETLNKYLNFDWVLRLSNSSYFL